MSAYLSVAVTDIPSLKKTFENVILGWARVNGYVGILAFFNKRGFSYVRRISGKDIPPMVNHKLGCSMLDFQTTGNDHDGSIAWQTFDDGQLTIAFTGECEGSGEGFTAHKLLQYAADSIYVTHTGEAAGH